MSSALDRLKLNVRMLQHTNFYSPVKTAKLRIIPLKFHNRVSMRVALQVCDPRKPPPPVQEPPKKTTPNKAVEDKVSKKKKQQADRVDWIGKAINKTTGLHMSPEDIERVVKSTPTGQGTYEYDSLMH